MKKIELSPKLKSIFKKVSTENLMEFVLLLIVIVGAVLIIWFWLDLNSDTSDENIADSNLIPNEEMLKYKRVKNEFDKKIEQREINPMPRNSFY